MAKEDFVPVACDDWYQRRRQGRRGEFWRKSPRHQTARTGDGGGTRQGIYMLTADGTLLAPQEHGQNPAVMRRRAEQKALAKWKHAAR